MSDWILGRYRISALVEEGASEVLPAEDTLLERQVGLVLVPVATASEPARLERIRQEVERAASFVHPNVATVYGLEEGDGRLFVTLEPSPGRSLATALAAGRLPLETILEIALTLSDVLIGAKQAGVVHGALHPGDIHLGDDGSITVGGFGLHEMRRATAAQAGGPSPAAAWRPPDAASGLLPDHRADLFALGRLVQEMLAAAEPDAEGRVTEETMSRLEGALDGLVSADPAQRPNSASEIRPHLEQVQRDLLREPEPEPESESEESAAAKRFNTPAKRGLVVAAVLLAVIAGWALLRGLGRGERLDDSVAGEEPSAESEDPVDLVVMPFAAPENTDDPDNTDEELLARGFGREVTRLLERNRRISVIGPDSAARATAGEADGEVVTQLAVAHRLEGSFLWQRNEDLSRSEVTVRLSRVSDGEILWDETLEAFFGEIAGLQDRIANGVARRLGAGARADGRPLTDSPGAYESYLEGVGRSAVATTPEELRGAVAGFEQAALLDSRLLFAHTGQVDLQIRLAAAEATAEALEAAQRALAEAQRVGGEDPEVQRATGEFELARGGAPAIALKHFEAALGSLPGNPDLLHAMALIDRRQGRWDVAIDRLVAARRRDPLDVELGADLVRTLTWKRRFDEAAEATTGLERLLPDALEVVLMRADLLLREQGDTGAARAVLERVSEAADSDSRWQERMLQLDLYDGEYETALARLPALALEEGEELIEGAWIHRHMGRDRRAAAGFERARDLLDDRLEAQPDNPWLSSLLGQAYGGTGGPLLAVRMGQRAVSQLPVTRDAVAGVEFVERFARIYVLAGDSEHALDELAFLLEIPSPLTVSVLRLDPTWDPLRDDPRFRELLERFGP